MRALINGQDMAFDDIGQGPAVVLIHDLALCRKMWQPQVECLLEQGYRIVTPDLHGHGESDADFRAFNLRECADDIIALLQYLGIGRAVFVGMGMSCSLLDEIRKHAPHKVVAICQLSPSRAVAGAYDEVRRHDLAELVREGHRLTAIDSICNQILPEQRSLATQQLAWDIQKWIETVDQATLATILTQSANVIDAASQTPALIVQGSRLTGSETFSHHRISGMFVETIQGAGHLSNLEQPERVNQCLLNFLNWLIQTKPRHYKEKLAA